MRILAVFSAVLLSFVGESSLLARPVGGYASHLWSSHFSRGVDGEWSGESSSEITPEISDGLAISQIATDISARQSIDEFVVSSQLHNLDDQDEDESGNESDNGQTDHPLTEWQIATYSSTASKNPLAQHVIASGGPTTTTYLVGIVALIVLSGGLLSAGGKR